MITPTSIEQAVEAARAALLNATSERFRTLELPALLALLFEQLPGAFRDAMNTTLDGAVDVYLGRQVQAQWPELMALLEALRARKIGSGNAFDLGRDNFIYLAEEREEIREEDPRLVAALESIGLQGQHEVTRSSVIVLTTQSEMFALLLQERASRWYFHVRRVHPDLLEEIESNRYLNGMQTLRERKDLTVRDIVAYAREGSFYADDTVGANWPQRPSLKTLLAASLVPGHPGASHALRYGDGRDSGFVLSVRLPLDASVFLGERPETAEAKDASWVPLGVVRNVLQRLNSAHVMLVQGDE